MLIEASMASLLLLLGVVGNWIVLVDEATDVVGVKSRA